MSLRHVKKPLKKRCSVAHCDSVGCTVGVSLHRFPLDFHRCKTWVQFCRNLNLEKAIWQRRHLRVCSKHLEPSAYLRSGWLHHDALPTRGSIDDTSGERSSHMDCAPSSNETSASVRRAVEPDEQAAVSGEPVAKGYIHSQSSQSMQLFQEADHTYAQPSSEASTSSLEPDTAGKVTALSASADLSPGGPLSTSPLSYEGSFTSPINERRSLQKLRAKLRRLRDRNTRLQGLLLQRRRMKTTAELIESA